MKNIIKGLQIYISIELPSFTLIALLLNMTISFCNFCFILSSIFKRKCLIFCIHLHNYYFFSCPFHPLHTFFHLLSFPSKWTSSVLFIGADLEAKNSLNLFIYMYFTFCKLKNICVYISGCRVLCWQFLFFFSTIWIYHSIVFWPSLFPVEVNCGLYYCNFSTFNYFQYSSPPFFILSIWLFW